MTSCDECGEDYTAPLCVSCERTLCNDCQLDCYETSMNCEIEDE